MTTTLVADHQKRQIERDQTTFTITLVAKPGQDGIRTLRAFLKLALRRFGLRCVDLQERTAK